MVHSKSDLGRCEMSKLDQFKGWNVNSHHVNGHQRTIIMLFAVAKELRTLCSGNPILKCYGHTQKWV